MRYDLHLHTCLSPCADRDMTPATVAGLAKLAGAELIASTDHNSALNLPAAEKACREYGLRLLPGLEVTTAEELHLLCYFKTVEAALEYGRELYAALPALPCDPVIWGEQWVRLLYTSLAAADAGGVRQLALEGAGDVGVEAALHHVDDALSLIHI